jgi:hypothetical protein
MDVLSPRRLNRASLRRQLLLERVDLPVCAAVERVAGLQAQAPNAPYVALWSRLTAFAPADLAEPLTDRRLVRTPLLRGTIHLVTAADAVGWSPLIRPVLAAAFRTNFAPRLPGVDIDALVADCAALLAERSLTRTELGAAMARRWPDADRTAMAYAATHLLALVQVPPRGVWGQTGQATWTATATWLAGQQAPAPTVEDLIRRCLGAFGPATVADLRAWSRLTGLRQVVAGMGLRTYRDEHGGTLYDLPDAELPDQETPAPPRFLAEYDNLLLSYADRTRVGADHRAIPLPPGIGGVAGTVLVDGHWRATWRLAGDSLVIEPFDRLSNQDRAEVGAEGLRLLGFIAPDAERPDVEFRQAG